MICRKCGKEIKEGAQFCTFCGSNVVQNEKIAISEFPKNAKNPDSRSTAKSSTKNKWVVGISAVVVLAVLAMAALFFSLKAKINNIGAENSDISWSFDEESGDLTISGIGATKADGKDALLLGHGLYYAPWKQNSIGPLTLNEKLPVQRIFIEDGVTVIGENLFMGMGQLRSVEIPESVAEIGDCSFGGCNNLTISVPTSVQQIHKNAFMSISGVDYQGSLFDWVNTLVEEKGTITTTHADKLNCTDAVLEFNSFCGTQHNIYVEYLGTKQEWQKAVKGFDTQYLISVTCSDGTIEYGEPAF